jgi:hypothetical protein
MTIIRTRHFESTSSFFCAILLASLAIVSGCDKPSPPIANPAAGNPRNGNPGTERSALEDRNSANPADETKIVEGDSGNESDGDLSVPLLDPKPLVPTTFILPIGSIRLQQVVTISSSSERARRDS